MFWTSGDVRPVGFKVRVDFSLAHFLAWTLFLRFTSSATPADLLAASMAAEPLVLNFGFEFRENPIVSTQRRM